MLHTLITIELFLLVFYYVSLKEVSRLGKKTKQEYPAQLAIEETTEQAMEYVDAAFDDFHDELQGLRNELLDLKGDVLRNAGRLNDVAFQVEE